MRNHSIQSIMYNIWTLQYLVSFYENTGIVASGQHVSVNSFDEIYYPDTNSLGKVIWISAAGDWKIQNESSNNVVDF